MVTQIHDKLIRIGTRGSALARVQALAVRDALLAKHDALSSDKIKIEIFTTQGDRILDRALGDVGGKGLFTQEIEDALLSNSIDLAVHSGKDLPTHLPDGLIIAAVLPREAPQDVVLSRHLGGLSGLPSGSLVGTASLRRQAQIKAARPDVEVINFRGSVQTRLKKLSDGLADATVLAAAGLNRLALDITNLAPSAEMLNLNISLPAAAQGIIGIEVRREDKQMLRLLEPINDPITHTAFLAERAVLDKLDGSCRTPIGAHAVIKDDTVQITAEVLTADGLARKRDKIEGPATDAVKLGTALGDSLKLSAADIIATFTRSSSVLE